MGPHGPDFMAIGDPSSLSLVPWQPGYARMVCYGHVNGKPYPFDSRVILKRQVDELAKQGFTLNTGIEPEFALLTREADGSVRPFDKTDTLDKPCYDYKGMSRSAVFLERLVDSLTAVGIDVYQVDHEDANGQFEINYKYSDCLTAADRLIFFKMAASEIAHSLGFVCTFMPKPFANRAGNGMHFHISLADGSGKNVFIDANDKLKMGLAKVGYHFIAGLMAHAKALCAIVAPSVNSYKRLVVGRSLSGATWAPAYIAYGNNNRSAMIRVIPGRVELRLPDGSANPYLVSAAIMAAGMDGIKRKLDPGTPLNLDLYQLSLDEVTQRKIDILPQNLGAALDALELDSTLVQALGPHFVAEFIRLKRMEWVDYQRHVSGWELAKYLEFY